MLAIFSHTRSARTWQETMGGGVGLVQPASARAPKGRPVPQDSNDSGYMKLLHKFDGNKVLERVKVFQFTRWYWMRTVGMFGQSRFAGAFCYEQESSVYKRKHRPLRITALGHSPRQGHRCALYSLPAFSVRSVTTVAFVRPSTVCERQHRIPRHSGRVFVQT